MPKKNSDPDKKEEVKKPPPLMCTRQRLPDYFPGQEPQTWANLASQGLGPRYFRKSKACWYIVSEVRDYLMETPVQTVEGDY